MDITTFFRTFSIEDGGGNDTRRRAAAWMKETLSTMDEKDVLTAQFTEDNTSTTAWVITRQGKNVKDIS